MAVYTYEISTEHNNYPNLTIYDRFKDGVARGWRVNANEGYVFYDKRENLTIPDPDTGVETPVTYYYTVAYLANEPNWDDFHYIAVLRSSVDENYIFGDTDNDHEVM